MCQTPGTLFGVSPCGSILGTILVIEGVQTKIGVQTRISVWTRMLFGKEYKFRLSNKRANEANKS